MNDQGQILKMLSEGTIGVHEAEKLLNAVTIPSKALPQFLKIQIDSENGKGPKVNIRIPLSLLRAGISFTSLIPQESRDKIQNALNQKGVEIDLAEITANNLETILESLTDLEILINDEETVRIYCE